MEREDLTRKEREPEVRAILDRGFDVRMIGRTVLGRRWRDVTPEQRDAFLELFRDYIAKAYARRLGGFAGESLAVVRSVRVDDKITMVQTRFRSKLRPHMRIDWRVRNVAGRQRIVDVAVEGVSMVATQRSTFTPIMDSEGVDGLLATLRENPYVPRDEPPFESAETRTPEPP